MEEGHVGGGEVETGFLMEFDHRSLGVGVSPHEAREVGVEGSGDEVGVGDGAGHAEAGQVPQPRLPLSPALSLEW